MYLCLFGNSMAILNRFAFTPIVKREVFLSFQKNKYYDSGCTGRVLCNGGDR